MLKCFFDRGHKEDASDGVMAVATVIFKLSGYKQFVRPWNRMLADWGASAFHATDFYNGGGEFKRNTLLREKLFEEDSKRIPKLIGENIYRISIVSFRPKEFMQAAPAEWLAHFGTSVHSQAIQLAIIGNGWWRKDTCPHERFACFMESGDPHQSEIVQTVERMRRDYGSGTAEVIGVQSFALVHKGQARGLEAADFAAWHWNKHYMDKITKGKENEPRKDFRAFVEASKNKVQYIFATGENLKYFFSRVPIEKISSEELNEG